MSAGIASMHDLSTVYGVEDAYDFLEILAIDSFNRDLAAEAAQRQN